MASTDETIRQALAANLHLASPAAMAQILTRGVYERPPHVDLINKYLAETVFGDLRRLLIALPPGHGKSKLCLVWYIIWRLAIRPQDRIGLITHTFELAREWGLEIRTIMNEFFPELGIEINEDSKAAHRWSTAEGGGLVCAGVGTALIGRRLNCFPAGTKVSTDHGPIAIEDLVKMPVKPRVLSRDGGATYRKITAVFDRVSQDGLVEIQTASGRSVRCTPEHRIFVSGQGYREARCLKPGDALLSAWEELPSLWRSSNRVSSDLPGMLPSGSPRKRVGGLRRLWEAKRVSLSRHKEVIGEGAEGTLLQQGVSGETSRQGSPRKTAGSGMRAMQRANRGKAFLPGSLRCVPEAKEIRSAGMARLRLPVLRERLPHEDDRGDVLLKGMREQRPLREDDGRRKLQIQPREVIRPVVSSHATPHHGTRRTVLRGLQRQLSVLHRLEKAVARKVWTRDSSSQRGRKGQLSRELDNALPEVSHTAPQIRQDRVSLVRVVHRGSVRVYDIEVEGSHCFFANEILVHNCVQVDDPVPDAEAAESPTQQEKVWKYLQWVINSRLEPGASVTMIHQRWSINDPIAKAVKAHELGPDSEGYDDWNLISIPALAEQNDILGRTEGSALWPQRFNEEALYRIRRAMGDYAFAAMFQQRPSPMGGGLIKEAWWNYWFPRGTAGDWPDVKVSGRTAVFAELPEHFDAIIQSWDMNFRDSVRAIQGGQEPDAVAGHVWGRKGADYFLLDRFWGKVGLNETIHAVREMTLNNPGAEAKLVEQAANGPAVMAKLRHEISGFIEVTPRGKKVARAMMMEAAPNSADRDARALTMAGAIQGGNFYLPHPGYRPWSEQFRHLVGQFPKDGKDDTDAMSQAWAFLARGQYKDLKRAHSEALQYREAPRSTQMIFNQKVRGMTEKAMQGDKHRNYWS